MTIIQIVLLVYTIPIIAFILTKYIYIPKDPFSIEENITIYEDIYILFSEQNYTFSAITAMKVVAFLPILNYIYVVVLVEAILLSCYSKSFFNNKVLLSWNCSTIEILPTVAITFIPNKEIIVGWLMITIFISNKPIECD